LFDKLAYYELLGFPIRLCYEGTGPLVEVVGMPFLQKTNVLGSFDEARAGMWNSTDT
jgi:hypothetical protein